MHPMRPWIAGTPLLLAACGGGSISLPRPTAYEPATEPAAAAWAGSTAPEEARDIRFRWTIRDDRGSAGGRGRVRVAVPDSARLDVRGPLGSGNGAAFVNGDTALWAEPEEDVRRLVPNYPIFWALMGVARGPVAGSSVRRSAAGESVTAWRYVRGADTTDYVMVPGPPRRLLLEAREAGTTVGTVETRFGPDGRPASARLIVPGVPARLDLTFYSNEKAQPFAPDTWTPPEP